MFGMSIPSFMLKQMYQPGSLENLAEGFQFAVRNPLVAATIVSVKELLVAGQSFDLTEIEFSQADALRDGVSVSEENPVAFGKGDVVVIRVKGYRLEPGEHAIALRVRTEEFGTLSIEVSDSVKAEV